MVHKISIKHVESTATDRLEPQNRISSQAACTLLASVFAAHSQDSMTGMFAPWSWFMSFMMS